MNLEPARDRDVAAGLLEVLAARGETLGCAESLTGGLLTARLVDVPGASRVLRGGIVCYATDLKASMLGVPADLLAERGAVDPDVAAAMAQGVCRVLAVDWGLATTGVAGPDPADGKPVGLAYVAVMARAGAPVVRELALDGDRTAIRAGVVAACLDLAADALARHTRVVGGPVAYRG